MNKRNFIAWTRLSRLFVLLWCGVGLVGASQLAAQANQNPQTSRMRGTTNAQRKAAAAKAAARRATSMHQQRRGLHPNAAVGTPGGVAVTDPAELYFSGVYPNYANSPLPNPSDTVNCVAPNFCGIRKFVDTLPGVPGVTSFGGANNLGQSLPLAVPDTTTFPGTDYYEIGVAQYTEKLHSDLPPTTLRGYCQLISGACAPGQPSYLGPLIVAQENRAVRLKFVNMLPTGTGGNLFIPVDTTVMGAGEGMAKSEAAYLQNRATLHLHGGNTPWISDGTPHQWTVPAGDSNTTYPKGDSTQNVPDMFFDPTTHQVIPQCSATVINNCTGGTPGQLPITGVTNDPGPGAMTFYWTNQQSARLMFYHDHAYGITRLNVYAGEAAGYLLRDATEATLETNGTIPPLTDNIPLVIQDKTFVPPNPSSAPVYSIGLLSPGSGYSAPTVNITGGGCTVAPAATATVGDIIDPFGQFVYGAITGVTLTNNGAGCTSDPVVTIDDPSGSGAAAFASLATLSQEDPTWDTALWGGTGNLWYPHVYMTNQWPDNPDGSNVNPMGRWDYGQWFFPPFANNTFQVRGPIPCPILGNPAAMCPGFPSVLNPAPDVDLAGALNKGKGSIASLTPEAFMDTPVINGTAYPTVTLQPKAYRFRILNAANDRTVNLSLFLACDVAGQYTASSTALPCPSPTTGVAGTEVGMVPAVATPGFPAWWPTDGRDGGVPDPAASGPRWTVIGTEGGILPAPAVIPPAPNNYEYNRRSVTVLNVSSHSLMLMPAERADVIVDFSAFAGKTLILYNDGAAPIPAFDTRYDYYTGDPDQTGVGGAPSTLPGFGPNTRTLMQIVVAAAPAQPFNAAALQTAVPAAFKASQPAPVVPEPAFNQIYGGNFPAVYGRLQNNGITFTPIGAAAPVTLQFGMKTIQELFELDYGRMNATLGTELPFTNFNTQTTIPLGYVDPPTENIYDSNGLSSALIGTAGDGTQIWQITHNGVDSHAIHFHLYNVQILNRFGWDGTTRPPEPIEMGWKDTVRMNPLEIDYVALRPMSQALPFAIPDSTRLLDVTMPPGPDPALSAVGPTGLAMPQNNVIAPLGWEYVWHCHILGHEENDMMRDQVFQVAPEAPVNLVAGGGVGGAVLTFTDKSASETGFTLERADDAGFSVHVIDTDLPPAQPGYGTVVTYTDTTIDLTGSAYYRVRAFKPDQSFFGQPLPRLVSAWSNVAYFPSPVATVNPTALNFGDVAYQSTSGPQTVNLSNTGAATLLITSIQIGGANPGDFAQSNNCPIGGAGLTTGQSCNITVTFTPQSIGSRSGSLLIASNDPVNPTLSVPMTGNGTPKALTITASSATVTYGSAVPAITPIIVGLATPPDTVASLGTITCSTTYTVGSAVASYPTTCSGAANANYNISYVAGAVTVTTAPLSITASNASRPYGVANPAFTATYSGFVNGETPAVLSGTLTCTTTATATSPVASYPITCSGQTSTNYTITYAPGTLTVTAVPLTITANNATRLAGAANPVFTVTYAGFVNGDTPASLGGALICTTTATVASPAGTYPITCSGQTSVNYAITFVDGVLTVTPAGPVLSVSPTALTFNSALNVTSAAQSVTVSNTGGAALRINGINLGGASPGRFTVTHNCPIGGTGLGAGAFCTVNVTFTPNNNANRSALLNVNVAAPAIPQSVTLTGTTARPAVSVSPASIGFGNVPINTTSAPQPVTVTNTGAVPLVISNIAIVGGNAARFTQTNVNCPIGGAGLAAGGSCTINVTFRPNRRVPGASTLRITDNATNSPQNVRLSGTGI